MKSFGKKFLGDLKLHSDYLRWDESNDRYETWEEAIDTIVEQHRIKYTDINLEEEFAIIKEYVYSKRVLFSQRNLQFRGDEVFKHNSRLFNCSSTYIDRPEVFRQIMYLLLSGCGVGFSVEHRYTSKLPSIRKRRDVIEVYTVPDSIEGWALAFDKLMTSFFSGGNTIRFDYSLIRPKGSLIAGRFLAPGHEPLEKSLGKIEKLLEEILQKDNIVRLNSVSIYDVICHAADAVLAAGLRRSALICLFDKNDEGMINSKTGNWFNENPQRGRSNNSAKLIEGQYTREEYDFFANKIKEFGEPGFFLVEDERFTTNP